MRQSPGTFAVIAMILLVPWISEAGASGLTGNLISPAYSGQVGEVLGSFITIYPACPSALLFAYSTTTASCASGTFTALYPGISESIGPTQKSVFFLSSADGGIKVTYVITDLKTKVKLFSAAAYGSVSSTSCSSPSEVQGSGSINASTIGSGDALQAFLNITFTGSGNPVFCTGGSNASQITLSTTPVTGSIPPLTTSSLKAGVAMQTVLNGFPGVSVTYQNNAGVDMSVFVLGVVRNGQGSTIDILSSSVTVGLGAAQNATAFLALRQYPKGTYDVTIIAITPSNIPVSTVARTTITV